MSTPSDPLQSETTYFIDAENAAEMARLANQDHIVTQSTGGLFPEQSDLSTMNDILDIACGPGWWALDVAHTYPWMKVVGVDISQLMVTYARSQAQRQRQKNVSFKVMDALKSLDVPDNSFDLVNMRFITAFMTRDAWPRLLQECKRILRSGGVLRVTESEWNITNAPASEKIMGMTARAVYLAGQTFSPDGRQVGITPVLGRLLRDAGFQNIQKMAHVLDFSFGAEAHEGWCQNCMVIHKLIQPFLIKMGVTTQEEIDLLYQQEQEEMQSEDFCGIMFYLTVWGKKP
ncbi:MAG: hypothetical protein NVSMB27_08290 [Ktedonobacteraceae bacterium]